MDALVIACLVLRRWTAEKRIPEPEFQAFRLEFIRPVTEPRDKLSSKAFDQFSETRVRTASMELTHETR